MATQRFRFETDAARRADGASRWMGNISTRLLQRPHYTVNKVFNEIEQAFDVEANVYYLVIDNGNSNFCAGEANWSVKVGSRWLKNARFGMRSWCSGDYDDVASPRTRPRLWPACTISATRPTSCRMATYRIGWWPISGCPPAVLNSWLCITYFYPNSPIGEGSLPTIERKHSLTYVYIGRYNKRPYPNQSPRFRWIASSTPVQLGAKHRILLIYIFK